MKLSLLLVLAVTASTCLAQTAKPAAAAASPQADSGQITSAGPPVVVQIPGDLVAHKGASGCPVVLTSAEMTPYLMLLHTGSDEAKGPGLDLHFRNASGKEIQSVELDAEFLARRTIYDLRAQRVDLHLTAQGTRSLDDALDHLRHLPLPARTNPVVLNRIRLEQVTFTDGSMWTPAKDDSCGFSPNGAQEIGAR